MALCTQCRNRPRPKDDSRMTCVPCTRDLAQQQGEESARRSRRKTLRDYWQVMHWKGNLIGLTLEEENFPPTATATYLHSVEDLTRVPKANLIDLDQWNPGFDRTQIKNMKSLFHRLNPQPKVRRRRKEPAGTATSDRD